METFTLKSLPAGEVDTDAEVADRRPADGREPCRRCLRNAGEGEPLVLAPYNPFTAASPYAGDGPVFVHADGCAPFEPAPGAVSEQVGGRLLSFRAYDADAMLTDTRVRPGERFQETVAELLGTGEAAFLHVHFAGPGCFAFRVDPA